MTPTTNLCKQISENIIYYNSRKYRGDNMNEIRKGDVVTRNSYGNDILFKVKRILKLSNGQKIAILKGVDVRIEADAPIEDLQLATKEEHNRCEKELENRIKSKIKEDLPKSENRQKEIIYTGKILHLDGESCLDNKNSH